MTLTPREAQIARFEAEEQRRTLIAAARAQCDAFGHLTMDDDPTCVRCGENTNFYDPFDPSVPF